MLAFSAVGNLRVYTKNAFNKVLMASPEECMVFNGALPEVLSIMGTDTGECIAFCVLWILEENRSVTKSG